MDAAAAVLGATDPATFRSGHDDLRTVLRQGPGHGVHLLGWWRGLRRLADDLGGAQNRDDVACLVALNVPGAELGLHLGRARPQLHARAPTGRCWSTGTTSAPG